MDELLVSFVSTLVTMGMIIIIGTSVLNIIYEEQYNLEPTTTNHAPDVYEKNDTEHIITENTTIEKIPIENRLEKIDLSTGFLD